MNRDALICAARHTITFNFILLTFNFARKGGFVMNKVSEILQDIRSRYRQSDYRPEFEDSELIKWLNKAQHEANRAVAPSMVTRITRWKRSTTFLKAK